LNSRKRISSSFDLRRGVASPTKVLLQFGAQGLPRLRCRSTDMCRSKANITGRNYNSVLTKLNKNRRFPKRLSNIGGQNEAQGDRKFLATIGYVCYGM